MCCNYFLLLIDENFLIHWQFPDQEVHIKKADVFAQYVENGCGLDKFEGFEVVKELWILKGAMDGQL